MNEFNYSSVLTRCMLISAIALVAGVAFPSISPAVFFMAALVPLIWYHSFYLRPRAREGLNQAAIDSVYYYGFLVTIGALGAAALNLSIYGFGEDFGAVAFQFGLGLLATGYAVWARVHLTASTKILDEEELREIMSQQIARSRELLVNIELVSSSFETFSSSLLQKSEQFSTRVEAQAKASITDAMKAFAQGISALSEQAQIALNDLRAIVNDVTFGAERETLRNSVASMVETVAQLSHGLNQLKASTTAGASSVGEFAGSLERVNSAAAGAADKLGALGQDRGIVAKFGEALIGGRQQTEEFGLAASVAASSITSVGDKATAAQGPVEEIGRKAAQVSSKFDKLSHALETAGRSGEAVAGANDALLQLTASTTRSSAEIESLQNKLQVLRATLENLNAALVDSTGGLKDSMIATSDALEGALQRALAASEEMSARLTMVPPSVLNPGHGIDRAASTL